MRHVAFWRNAFFVLPAVLITQLPELSARAMSNPSSVVVTSFGTVGQGADDTGAFQAALNRAAIKAQTLEIPPGTYNVRPLYIPANSSVLLDAGVVIQALPGYRKTDRLVNISDVQNVSISGTPGQSIFRMLKSDYTTGEFRLCLAIEGATNVTIDGIQCNDSGGD